MAICLLVLQLNRIKVGGKKIAGGDYSASSIRAHGVGHQEHAQALNNIGLGMAKAVRSG
jgi:hypothetical protein